MKPKSPSQVAGSHTNAQLLLNRRQFLRHSGSLALGTGMLAAMSPTGIFAANDQTIRLALIGCGGRGTGAVRDALSVENAGPIKLYAMADLHRDKLESSLQSLRKAFPDKTDVAADRKFIGFDSHRHAIDLLRPGDIALCTTRAYIRPVHVEYAIRKGINVFMEKPFAADPGGLHRLLKLAGEADQKGIKVAAGLQCRHSPARQALIERIRNGDMGEIPLIRANRLGGVNPLSPQGPAALNLVSQLQFGRAHLYWIGSGQMVDNLIHQVDECCWIKDAWPVSANGMGGCVSPRTDCGQNLDVYSMEFTFADGTKAFCGFRRMKNARSEFATFIHGTKCAAQFSGEVHAATVHLFKDQRIRRDNIAWTPPKDANSPWQFEWNEFIKSIRENRKHNEIQRAVFADLTTLMGRAACHTGQTVTWSEMMESRFQFCNDLDNLNANSPVPVSPDAQGRFPIPVPGEWKEL